MAGRQIVSGGDFGITGFAAAEGAAFGEQLRSGSAMDCAVHASAAKKRAVGRVHDGVYIEFRDVALHDFNASCHGRKRSRGQPAHFALLLQWFLPAITIKACSSLKWRARSEGASCENACSMVV